MMKVTTEEDKMIVEFGSDKFNKILKTHFIAYVEMMKQIQDIKYAEMSMFIENKNVDEAPADNNDVYVAKTEENPKAEEAFSDLDTGITQNTVEKE